MRIDMHLHTDASFDCINDGDAVVAVARARGVDGICVTDHNEIARAQELHERHPDFVIVGEEVKTAERVDIIGLFIQELIPKSLKIQVYKAVLESNASEHGARMTAMDKATDNAGELLKALKLTYNRSRQAAITTEILEIVGGAEALAAGR